MTMSNYDSLSPTWLTAMNSFCPMYTSQKCSLFLCSLECGLT